MSTIPPGKGVNSPETNPPEIRKTQSRQRTLLLVHGRGVKPAAKELEESWIRALTHGLQRDHQRSLEGVNVRMIYYGDFTREYDPEAANYDESMDLADLANAFGALAKLKSAKLFRRSNYEALPGQSPLREFLADIGVPVFRLLGLGQKRLARYMPELAAYWADSTQAQSLRHRFLGPLNTALDRGDHVLIISHCTGSVICYDAFFDARRDDSRPNRRVHSWITLGSPLADDDVKRNLLGQPDDYPNMLINWFNIAAEDDPYCHDETVANDFQSMLSSKQISRIQDYHVYNLTERYGSSDPHSALGYLIHPRTGQLVVNWLNAVPDT